jgi:molybdopterin converting factor subunit 1
VTAQRMRISVRLFALMRERAGTGTLELELDDGARVADALAALGQQPALEELVRRIPLRVAVNREYAATDTELHAGDELAVIPPVSGGASAVAARVSSEPLSRERLVAAVGDPGAGAVVVFEGRTREVERLEYEAYVEMAAERIELIMRECAERHSLHAALAEHRVGPVPLGEPSVIVAVSAAHRDEAFAGAREAIDRIKAEVPIWKREHPRDAEPRWVSGSPPPSGR